MLIIKRLEIKSPLKNSVLNFFFFSIPCTIPSIIPCDQTLKALQPKTRFLFLFPFSDFFLTVGHGKGTLIELHLEIQGMTIFLLFPSLLSTIFLAHHHHCFGDPKSNGNWYFLWNFTQRSNHHCSKSDCHILLLFGAGADSSCHHPWSPFEIIFLVFLFSRYNSEHEGSRL